MTNARPMCLICVTKCGARALRVHTDGEGPRSDLPPEPIPSRKDPTIFETSSQNRFPNAPAQSGPSCEGGSY